MALWKQTTDLERINSWNRGCMVEHLGMWVTEVGEDFIRGTMPVDARTRQPFGLLHGGASVALAESLGSLAGNLCLDSSEMAVGLEINANHVRAVTAGSVTGTARALHIGRSTQVWEIRIEDERGRLVCISRLTLAVVPRASPKAV
ncbi:hotdog fold thioesterase [Dokdonella sp.]|uniref:hotdog fold thioesterase n=1 Tax=Dokdonella sp. TaxID=2291710 RepID=UPI0025C16F84|nr:hotdog fold thioesterase [Dokdonella sp.]MBX3690091.1 hotdog fold thioesterase [Dokdonella sp.]